MAIHVGKKIKDELYKQGVSVSIFAKKINRSRNVVYDIFERESIDTELLYKIGKILSYDFFSLYSSQKEYHLNTKNSGVNETLVSYNKQAEDLKFLKQQNEAQQTEITHLKKIIALLENKKKK